jgi:hypothetical protein
VTDTVESLNAALANSNLKLKSAQAFKESYQLHNISMNKKVIEQRKLILALKEDIKRLETKAAK